MILYQLLREFLRMGITSWTLGTTNFSWTQYKDAWRHHRHLSMTPQRLLRPQARLQQVRVASGLRSDWWKWFWCGNVPVRCFMPASWIVYTVYGKICRREIFAFFEGRAQSTRKLKLGETPTHRYFTCNACGGCGSWHWNTNANISEGSRAIPQKFAPSKISRYTVLWLQSKIKGFLYRDYAHPDCMLHSSYRWDGLNLVLPRNYAHPGVEVTPTHKKLSIILRHASAWNTMSIYSMGKLSG